MGVLDGEPAAIVATQLSGGALNVNPHLHALAADGVFRLGPDGAAEFVCVLSPTDADVATVCKAVLTKVQRLVERRVDSGDIDPEWVNSADQQLAYAPVRRQPHTVDVGWEHPREPKPLTAAIHGYSLHAATFCEAEERGALERLCRYVVRSSFCAKRLSLRADGQVVYRLKRPFAGQTELVMDKASLIRRLVKQIPRPGFHLVRYFGGFAARARIRSKLLALVEPLRGPDSPSAHRCLAPPPKAKTKTTPAVDVEPDSPCRSLGERESEQLAEIVAEQPWPATSSLQSPDEPFIRQRRLSWAELLKRTFAVDVLVCPNCDGRLRVIAAISEPHVVAKVLSHLGLPTDRPTLAPARASPLPFDFDDLNQDVDNDPTWSPQ